MASGVLDLSNSEIIRSTKCKIKCSVECFFYKIHIDYQLEGCCY